MSYYYHTRDIFSLRVKKDMYVVGMCVINGFLPENNCSEVCNNQFIASKKTVVIRSV